MLSEESLSVFSEVPEAAIGVGEEGRCTAQLGLDAFAAFADFLRLLLHRAASEDRMCMRVPAEVDQPAGFHFTHFIPSHGQ